MAELELYRVRKAFDANTVVNDVSVKLPSGKLLTLLGPSGCGKSTTLRIIAGLTAADAGVVRIGDRDVTRIRPAQRNIGMVFQSLALFPHMTVADNIGFALRVQRVPAAARKKRIQAVLDLTRMSEFGGRYPSQISGGQRQRVALARAIVFSPDVLLLDEPFSALDRKLREEMQQELRALVNRIGVTTVFVTHDQEEAIRLSDYVAVMRNGCIDQLDTPEVIYSNPATAFVADFMGAVNFVEGTVMDVQDQEVRVKVGDTVISAPLSGPSRPACGSTIRINVRPERAAVTRIKPPDGPALKGRVINRVFEGAFTAYEVQLEGLPTRWLVREPAGRYSGFATPSSLTADDVWVTWSSNETHLMSA